MPPNPPPPLPPSLLNRRLAAGVNRRWHDAAHAPELCRDVAIVSQNPGRELASLLPWLRRHGRHVRCLTLQMYGPLEEQDQQLLHGCLAACAAVGQLESLAVKALRHWDPLEVGAWVQALPRLQSLALNSDSVHLTSSLHQLPALRRLALEVDHNSTGEGLLRLGAGVRLPPQLEELELTLNWHVLLPQASPCSHLPPWHLYASLRLLCLTAAPLPTALLQVAGLSHLHTLALTGANNTTAGAGIVDQLPRLRRLHLKKLPVLPEWLPGCQALEELVLNSVRNCDADSLDAALRELTGLTKL